MTERRSKECLADGVSPLGEPSELDLNPDNSPSTSNNNNNNVRAELEQRMLAIQQLYRQKQADLLLHFQQSQAQLALQHIRLSQQVFQEFVQQRTIQRLVDQPPASLLLGNSSHGNSVAPAVSLPTVANSNDQNQPDFSDDLMQGDHEIHNTVSETHLIRSAAGGSGTISARTREKLKAMIHSKQRHRTSNSGSPQYEPYPKLNQNDHELRKATSEPNLKMKGVAALRAKLMERNSINVMSYGGGHSSATDNGQLTDGQQQAQQFFNAPSLPNISAHHQLPPELTMPPAGHENVLNSLFFSVPSMFPYLTNWAAAGGGNFMGLPGVGGNASASRWSGSADDLSASDSADRAFRPFDRRHMTVTLPPSQHGLLRQQLRDLVLRRKSLVREETEDDIKRESSWSSLASVIEAAGEGASFPGGSLASNFSRKTTGVAYDSLMCRHQCTCGDNSQHVEHGGRVQSIWARLQETGLVDECEKVLARKAPLDYLRLCHGDSYTTFFAVSPTACLKMDAAELPLKSFVQLPCGGIGVDSDTYFNDTFTPASARSAVGCVVELCAAVADGRLKNGFAVVRPPGHHAEPNQALGFCYFNNVAIAAKVLQQKFGVKKIAIVDWDVHHGNGTQLIFENDPNVLYVSLHRHDGGNFFPGTGSISEVGIGEGEGFNVNIAWSGEPMGDAEYLAAWRTVVGPVLDHFRPQFVLVSCGFDAARGHWNALGGYNLSSRMFGWMTKRVTNYADGKVALVLEGGYDLAAISDAAECCVRALLSSRPSSTASASVDKIVGNSNEFFSLSVDSDSYTSRPNKSSRQTLEKVVDVHKRYWPMLSTDHLDASQSEYDISLRRRFAQLSVAVNVVDEMSTNKSLSTTSDDDDDEDEDIEVVDDEKTDKS